MFTLAHFLRKLDRTVQRTDLTDEYPEFVRQALRLAQDERSWLCMRHITGVTMVAGTSSVRLPDNFKEFTHGRSPVGLRSSETPSRVLPCDLTTREMLHRLDAALLYPVAYATSTARRGFPVYVDWQAGLPTLNIIDTATQDLLFDLSYYGYLPELQATDDHNALTDTYPTMIEAKAAHLAFAEIADPQAADFELLYQTRRRSAVTDDARRELAGRRLQMGG